MRLLVTGAAGQLGTAMVAELSHGHEVTGTTATDLDICDHARVVSCVEQLRPEAIVNCAAFTDVDAAEQAPVRALEVNAFAVQGLAQAASRVGAALVHFSSDFVFDGTATRPYAEDDRPNPRSTYACSKLLGEWFARGAGRHYVLRVESLFGVPPDPARTRRSSVEVIVTAIRAGRPARVFVDRTVSPSHVGDVARAARALLERGAAPGLYHCVNAGQCTWYEFGVEVCRQLGIERRLEAISLADAKLRADRPRFCALSPAKLASVAFRMPPWQDALARFLAALA